MSSRHVSEAEVEHEEEMPSATRVAVVTGVARCAGIGHAVSAALLDRGLAVIGLDCRPLEVSSPLRSRGRFRFKTASVRDHREVYDAVNGGLRELGESSVSVVVNNAAISDPFMKSRPAGGGGAAADDEGGSEADDGGAASGTEDAEISDAPPANERLRGPGGGPRGGGDGRDEAGDGDDDDDENERRLGAVAGRLDEFDAYTSTNLRSAFLVTEVCRPFFPPRAGPGERSGDVSVIHIGSTRARQSEREGSEGYASAKAGLVGLMHAQGQSLAGRARVNVVSPGWIDTEDEGECIVTERDRRWHAAGRVGTPADVAELVSFLADEEKSGFVTCEEFVVDGGVSRRMYYPV